MAIQGRRRKIERGREILHTCQKREEGRGDHYYSTHFAIEGGRGERYIPHQYPARQNCSFMVVFVLKVLHTVLVARI